MVEADDRRQLIEKLMLKAGVPAEKIEQLRLSPCHDDGTIVARIETNKFSDNIDVIVTWWDDIADRHD